jgi:hypothetical protein
MPLYRGTRYPLLTAGSLGAFISAPSLAWDEEGADTTPDFLVAFDATVEAGDVVRIQVDDDAAFPSPAAATDALDAGEIAAGQTTVAFSELANGSYFARARVERSGVASSPWSNVEEITIAA